MLNATNHEPKEVKISICNLKCEEMLTPQDLFRFVYIPSPVHHNQKPAFM